MISWLSEQNLKAKQVDILVTYLEAMVQKNTHVELRDQYKITNNQVLSNILLSPRACIKKNDYTPCGVCYNNIKIFVKTITQICQ